MPPIATGSMFPGLNGDFSNLGKAGKSQEFASNLEPMIGFEPTVSGLQIQFQ
jgi:hypothetical protein